MKFRTRYLRAVVAGAGVLALSGLGGGAFAAPAANINDGGITDDDPSTPLIDEGAAIDCGAVSGYAQLKTDAAGPFGFTTTDLNVVGLKLDANLATPGPAYEPADCSELQDVTSGGGTLGAGAAGGELVKLAGKMQSSDLDCVSDTLEAFVGKVAGDEYPLSGKFVIGWEGTNPLHPLLKPYQSQAYLRTTTGTVLTGETIALTGIVIKGVALGAVNTMEAAFSPTTGVDDGDGYMDWAPDTVGFGNWFVDADGDEDRSDFGTGGALGYDADDDGTSVLDGVGGVLEDDDGNGRPDNFVSESCLDLFGIDGGDLDGDAESLFPETPFTALPADGDGISKVTFNTDGAYSGGTLNSSMHFSFQP